MTTPCMEQPSYRLSIEQLAELQQAFNEFDMDGDNFISTKELGWAMRAMGMNPTEPEILDLINEVAPAFNEYLKHLWFLVRHRLLRSD